MTCQTKTIDNRSLPKTVVAACVIALGGNVALAAPFFDLKRAIQEGVNDALRGTDNRRNPQQTPSQPNNQNSRMTRAGTVPSPAAGPIFPKDIAIYDGPSRFTEPLQAGVGGIKEGEEQWPLKKGETIYATVSTKSTSRWPGLRCYYLDPSNRNSFRSVGFWLQTKPEMEIANMQQWLQFFSSGVDVDIAVTECPPNWGEAMNLAWGPEAFDQLKAKVAQQKEEVEKRQLVYKEMEQKKAEAWRKSPLTANPIEKDRQLAREIDQGLDAIIARRNDFDEESYRVELGKRLVPLMTELARSGAAQAAAIPTGEKGRAHFIAWDNGIAYTVMSRVKKMRALSRLAWSQTDLMHIWWYYMDLYEAQINDKGALDRAYATRLQAAMERDPSGSIAHLVKSPDYSPRYSNNTVTMDPDQSLLYRSVNTAITGIAEVASARAMTKQYVADLDRVTGETRQAFWSCYEKRCTNNSLWLDYTRMLNAKDNFYIMRYLQTAWLNKGYNRDYAGGMLQWLGGADGDVDGALPKDCEQPYNRMMTPYVNRIMSGGTMAIVDVAMTYYQSYNDKDHLAARVCRDRMEFIFRPRSKAGLI